MAVTTYQLIDVLSTSAKALNKFEESVSGLEYSTEPGYPEPMPIAEVPLVPQLISERWNQALENLCLRSLNNYQVLAELEGEEWPDPAWSLVKTSSVPLHCTRYTYQSGGRGAPTEYLVEASRRFPKLLFGCCWMLVDGSAGEIGKQEIRNGEIHVDEHYLIDDDPNLFVQLASRWLGLSFADEN